MGAFLVGMVFAAALGAEDRGMGIAVEATEAAREGGAGAEEERRARAEALYLQALARWHRREWEPAWRLATEALVVDPNLAPARLLTGYALLRLRRWEEARATIAGLSSEVGPATLPKGARRDARRYLRRKIWPMRRDQWGISVAHLTVVERVYEEATAFNGYVFTGRAPLLPRLAARADAGAPWGGTAGPTDLRGPRFAVAAESAHPLGPGNVHATVLAGPLLWVAEGRYWADGSEAYLGARGALGLDVRLGAVVGLRAEVGASVFPGLSDDLPFYASPIDVRVGIDTWFGR